MTNFALNQLLGRINAQQNIPLASFSTMKVGGNAQHFVQITNEQHLLELSLACFEYDFNWHILSGGSNTLFGDDGFKGIIIKLSDEFNFIKNISFGYLEVGSCTSYAKISKQALAKGCKSALGWLGTPGLVGGALRMNAGTKLGVIGDVVDKVEGVLLGKKVLLSKDELFFDYRFSSLPKDLIVTKVFLNLAQSGFEDPALLSVKAAQLKERRLTTQPRESSLGSFFKNPLPHHAGKLIEDCGLKGFSCGPAQISPTHANFIINRGKAKARDVIFVANEAKKCVLEMFGVTLETEIRLVGEGFNS